jgi:hypothetical protein
MPEQASETESDDEAQQDGSEDHQGLHSPHTHEQGRSDQYARCRFDDFAMI